VTYDDVVVGAGTAGLVAGIRLAEAGRRVAVLARGVGATRLAPATVDVLGYAEDGAVVERPRDALRRLRDERPAHPYALLPLSAVSEALEWLGRTAAPLGYGGSTERNVLVPTAVGAVRPTAYAPASIAAGDVGRGGRVLLVGFHGLKDFYARYAAANLRHTAPQLASVEAVELRVPLGDEADPGTLGFARRFEAAAFRDAVVAGLEPWSAPGVRLGFPAVLGLAGAEAVRAELEERLAAEVFEIPTLPPSVPGLRLYERLRAALREAGGRLVVGAPVIGADIRDGRVERVHVQAAGRRVAYAAEHVVLATGGFAAGGLELTSRGEVRETVLGLPVEGTPPGRPQFAPGYLDPQPLARAGIAADETLRPIDAAGTPVLANVRIAGALLAGAEPSREASGEGISVATGYAAAGSILEGGP
jgi:glycerol-3-phosphate dehydrogenase subunit B